jgi:hypothetical protein
MAKRERESIEKLTDWRGNTIERGTIVLYPKLFGRSAVIAEGEVVDIFQTRSSEYSSFEKRITIKPIRTPYTYNSTAKYANSIISNIENVTAVK